jgi:hypothetical protein
VSDAAYTPASSGIRQIAQAPAMSAAMLHYAKAGARAAEAIAPRRKGVYAASFRTEARDVIVAGERRRGAAVVNDAAHASLVEWHDGYHVLARAAAAIRKA